MIVLILKTSRGSSHGVLGFLRCILGTGSKSSDAGEESESKSSRSGGKNRFDHV